MKTKIKKAIKTRARSAAKKAPSRRRVAKNRPFHKRIALHPVSLLLLLCVGVLLGGVTFHSFADSYTVTAQISATLPTAPATITSPASQLHFTSKPIMVTGTCQPNTYIKLYRNNVFSGTANCGAGQTTFQINTDLSLGSNVLQPQIFNVTDQAGPASSPVTVFYDEPVLPPIPAPVPAAPPTTLQITAMDSNIYQADTVPQVSSNPTVSGIAPPYSHIVIIFHPAVLTCETYADSNGNWSCTLDQSLSNGLHTVNITATTPDGRVLTYTSRIRVVSQLATSPPATHFFIQADYHYQVYKVGQTFSWNLALSGGSGPYALTVLWGDGGESTIVRNDQASFTVTHAYNTPVMNKTDYAVKIKAVDSNGATAFLQSVAIVSGNSSGAGLACNGSSTSPCNAGSGSTTLLTNVKQWLRIIWPTYLVVLLMVLSFWLGERQEYYKFFRRKHVRRHA